MLPLANTAENHLIGHLPAAEQQQLLQCCESVPLEPAEMLSVAGKLTHHIYFPVEGLISLAAPLDGHAGLEVGLIGREGMLGLQVTLAVLTAPLDAMVRGPGRAWRLGTGAFLHELQRSPALHSVLQHYLHVRMLQLTTAAACLRFHQIGPRLARRLLMQHDRSHADQFHLTHEVLAELLGVRRVSITIAASLLQRRGLIRYQRGTLTVLDRAGLETAACSCYAADQQAYRDGIP
ncbi:MAG: hypothetical protein RJA44_638 [Pseudomonadota bacterium]|jgi:CRP-like cAMP-binding protein